MLDPGCKQYEEIYQILLIRKGSTEREGRVGGGGGGWDKKKKKRVDMKNRFEIPSANRIYVF